MDNLFELKKEVINANVEEKSGVYQIRCCKNNQTLPISRLINTDSFGILSIGSSINVRQRLKQFVDGMSKGKGHSSGNRYYYFELNRKEMLGEYNLMFVVRYTEDYEKEEAKLMRGYSDYFGELPPLNNQETKYKYEDEDMYEYPKDFDWQNQD